MNTLKKLTTGALLSVLALTSMAPARASEAFDVTLPALTAATKAVSVRIASDLTAYFRSAMKAPRAVHVRKSPMVIVSEVIESAMETVTVAATRLPIETVVVAATRLPQVVDPVELAQTIPTAQVRL